MIGWDAEQRYSFGQGRIAFPSEEIGYEFWFEDLVLPVIFTLDAPTDDTLNNNFPAEWHEVPDGQSIMIWIHESVPPQFRDIVAFHELIEAKLATQNCMSDTEIAHRVARAYESAYAFEHLGAEELIEWNKYRSTFYELDKSRPLRELLPPVT